MKAIKRKKTPRQNMSLIFNLFSNIRNIIYISSQPASQQRFVLRQIHGFGNNFFLVALGVVVLWVLLHHLNVPEKKLPLENRLTFHSIIVSGGLIFPTTIVISISCFALCEIVCFSLWFVISTRCVAAAGVYYAFDGVSGLWLTHVS